MRPVLAGLAVKRCQQNEESGKNRSVVMSFTKRLRFLASLESSNLEFEPRHDLHLARMEPGRQATHLAKAARLPNWKPARSKRVRLKALKASIRICNFIVLPNA